MDHAKQTTKHSYDAVQPHQSQGKAAELTDPVQKISDWLSAQVFGKIDELSSIQLRTSILKQVKPQLLVVLRLTAPKRNRQDSE